MISIISGVAMLGVGFLLGRRASAHRDARSLQITTGLLMAMRKSIASGSPDLDLARCSLDTLTKANFFGLA
jgi:hypothetical protein